MINTLGPTHGQPYVDPIEGIVIDDKNLLPGEFDKCPQPIM
jgi:hypothetical protein